MSNFSVSENPAAAVVYAVATLDTKSDELRYVVKCLQQAGIPVRVVDVSSSGASRDAAWPCDVIRPQQLMVNPGRAQEPEPDLATLDRGAAVTRMADRFAEFVAAESAAGRISGMLGIGGSGGTAIITAGMRRLPVGLPKLMVSTVASGNTAAYVDCSDICMMYSVVDVCGLNVVSTRILSNAAHAMAGMVSHRAPASSDRPAVGMTMFGVTTPCVTHVRELLEQHGFECLVFHATGSGGRAMEKLVESGLLQGVLDITTTEVADEVVGGVFPAGPDRLDVLIRMRIPLVLSSGAVDMVNFAARETVPSQFADRKLYIHNPQVTLMRTTVAENVRAAQWIAAKLNHAQSPFTILLPELGVSALDRSGQPFFDPDADLAFFDTLQQELSDNPHAEIRRLPLHINDPAFAEALVDAFLEIMNATGSARR